MFLSRLIVRKSSLKPIPDDKVKRAVIMLLQMELPILKTEHSLQKFLFILDALYYKRTRKTLWDSTKKERRWVYNLPRVSCKAIHRLLTEDADIVPEKPLRGFIAYKLNTEYKRIIPNPELQEALSTLITAVQQYDLATVGEKFLLRHGIFSCGENEEIKIENLFK